MTTWNQLLAALRRDLLDDSSKPRWTTEYLYQAVCDAVRDYSIWFPRRIDRYQLTLAGLSYALPADYVSDVMVECPLDTMLKRREDQPGMSYRTKSAPTYYYITGGNLYLNGTTDEDVYLTYLAVHSIPSSETDTAFVFTIPDLDLELIRLYAQGKALEQMRDKQARLDRFEPGSGRRDDNPLTPETSNLMASYYRKIAERQGGAVIKLYRTGRVR